MLGRLDLELLEVKACNVSLAYFSIAQTMVLERLIYF